MKKNTQNEEVHATHPPRSGTPTKGKETSTRETVFPKGEGGNLPTGRGEEPPKGREGEEPQRGGGEPPKVEGVQTANGEGGRRGEETARGEERGGKLAKGE